MSFKTVADFFSGGIASRTVFKDKGGRKADDAVIAEARRLDPDEERQRLRRARASAALSGEDPNLLGSATLTGPQ